MGPRPFAATPSPVVAESCDGSGLLVTLAPSAPPPGTRSDISGKGAMKSKGRQAGRLLAGCHRAGEQFFDTEHSKQAASNGPIGKSNGSARRVSPRVFLTIGLIGEQTFSITSSMPGIL